MKQVFTFDTGKGTYTYVNLVAKDLGLRAYVLHTLLTSPHMRSSDNLCSTGDLAYAGLPYIGQGITINKERCLSKRDWRITYEEADLVKKRFAGLDNTTKKKLVDLSNKLQQNWWNEHCSNHLEYTRACLRPYLGKELSFVGTIAGLRVVWDSRHEQKVVRVYVEDITSPESTNINIDHASMVLSKNGYLVLRSIISVDDIFNGGIRVRFKATVKEYTTERRCGLFYFRDIYPVLGGGNKLCANAFRMW